MKDFKSPFSDLTSELWQKTLLETLVPDQKVLNEFHNAWALRQMQKQDFIAKHGQEAWDALPENVEARARRWAMVAVENMAHAITDAAIECIKKWPESRSESVFQWLIEVAETWHDHECDY